MDNGQLNSGVPTLQYTIGFESPIGIVRLTAIDAGLTGVDFAEGSIVDSVGAPAFVSQAIEQLQEYFEGKRRIFDTLPLAIRGTDFQMRVWDALDGVRYGQTVTYGELTKELKLDGGAQAVGQALTRNHLCLLIPCHRIVPAEGGVGGYAYGEERKRWLLAHERNQRDK